VSLLLGLLLVDSAVAQPPPGAPVSPRLRFQHLTNDDGLSQINVSSVFQDRRGFMWFGTQDGLNRYDGYRFTVYRPVPFDTTSLLDTGIMALAEDGTGQLWVSVAGGVEQLDPFTGRAHHFRPDPDDPTSLNPSPVSAIHVGPSGTVWLGTAAHGLSRFDEGSKRFHHYRHDGRAPASLSSDAVTALYTDAEGVLWVGTVNGLNRLRPNGGGRGNAHAFYRYLYDRGGARPAGGLWPNHVPASPTQRAAFVTALCEEPGVRGVVWVTTAAGLVRLDTRTGETRRFTPDTAHPDGNVLSAVVPDPRTPGVLWVASLGGPQHAGGLYHFDTTPGGSRSYEGGTCPARPTA
jgi:ligand-binding sensor domain-containing protein